MMREVEGASGVPPPVSEVLDAIVGFGGHNQFVGAGEKAYSVGELRAMVAAGHRPAPQAVEDYLRERTREKGARRIRAWYETIIEGGYLMDGGRRI